MKGFITLVTSQVKKYLFLFIPVGELFFSNMCATWVCFSLGDICAPKYFFKDHKIILPGIMGK